MLLLLSFSLLYAHLNRYISNCLKHKREAYFCDASGDVFSTGLWTGGCGILVSESGTLNPGEQCFLKDAGKEEEEKINSTHA